MPMYLDERTDYLVLPIPESSDLPLFLCHFLSSSDPPAKQLRDLFLAGKLRGFLRAKAQINDASSAIRRVAAGLKDPSFR